MKKISLAIICQKYRPDGGAERFILDSLKTLYNKKLQLNIITRQWTNNKINCHLHICNPFFYNRLSKEKNFAKTVRRYLQQHYFTLVQSHERIVGCNIFRAGSGVHSTWLKQRARIIPSYKRFLISKSYYHKYILNEEYLLFNSDNLKKIICNSAMVRDDIINNYNVALDKCVIIYNAVDPKYFMPPSDKQRLIARQILSIPNKAYVFIFVGSGFARKGLKQALYAISATNRYLIVVGRDKYEYQYKSLAHSLGCASRIRFLGIRQNILPYYHASDAFILPTLYDPFPNSILEAMSCGLPVITSKYCGATEFIEQGCQGFICDALDIISLKKFVSEMPSRIHNPTMSLAAQKRVSLYTPDNLSQKLMSLYKKLI